MASTVRSQTSEKKRSRNLAMKRVVAKLAKAQIKKLVPTQVYRDCAEIIN